MKAERVPFVRGITDLPARAVWLALDARTAVNLLALYKAHETRPWHTISFWVYDVVGTRTCYVAHTWQASAKELAELKEFLHL